MRKDTWAQQVFVRLQAVVITLPAYDSRYHTDCYNKFCKVKQNAYTMEVNDIQQQRSQEIEATQEPLLHVVDHIDSNSAVATWTATELCNIYTNKAATS